MGTASLKIASQVDVTVALTREAGKNGKLASLLAERGIRSVEIPCIAHADGKDSELLPPTLAEFSFSYVAITSPEAASVFLKGWRDAGKPPVSVACVGKATGEALERGGVTPVFTPSKANGETLATELPLPMAAAAAAAAAAGTGPVASILYPASSKAQRTLEDGLAARGFAVRRLDVYDTVPADWSAADEAAAATAAVAAFGSPSAVKTWAARRGVAGCLAACIGETSAVACRKQGWPEEAIFYPEQPGMDGWVAAVARALQARVAS